MPLETLWIHQFFLSYLFYFKMLAFTLSEKRKWNKIVYFIEMQ